MTLSMPEIEAKLYKLYLRGGDIIRNPLGYGHHTKGMKKGKAL